MSTQTKRRVPLLDLSAQHKPIRDEILAEVTRIIDTQQFVMGQDLVEFEREMAAYCGAAHAIGCASGSDALYLALLGCGVEPGDEVITTPFTFFASAGSIVKAGGRPVFADIDPRTFNMDPEALRAVAPKHPGAKAVIPIHLYGGCADMDPILEIAREHNWTVIEDGAQAIGAEYKGRRALSMGDVGCLSFFPSKNLGAMGDAGMMTTGHHELADKLAKLRVHGETERYLHRWVGTNSRMDNLQAAILRVKLRRLDEWTVQRQRNASRYHQHLDPRGLSVTLPSPAPYQTRHIFNQFVIRCRERDALQKHLGENGVDTKIYYPVPLHLQECFAYLGYAEGEFPASEQAAREVLALPVAGPGVGAEEVEYVCEAISGFADF